MEGQEKFLKELENVQTSWSRHNAGSIIHTGAAENGSQSGWDRHMCGGMEGEQGGWVNLNMGGITLLALRFTWDVCVEGKKGGSSSQNCYSQM